jgi:hypothetical protein
MNANQPNKLKWKTAWPGLLGCAWFGVLMELRHNSEGAYTRMAVAGLAFAVLAFSFSVSVARIKRDRERKG